MEQLHVVNTLKKLGIVNYHISEVQEDFDITTYKFEYNTADAIAVKLEAHILIGTLDNITPFMNIQVQIEGEGPVKTIKGFKIHHITYGDINSLNLNYLYFQAEMLIKIKGIMKGNLILPSDFSSIATLEKAYIKTTLITPEV